MTHSRTLTAAPITEREWEVLRSVAEGRSDKEIASVLFISQFTVRKHLEHIFAKLNVHNRTAAVARVRHLVAPRSYAPGILADQML